MKWGELPSTTVYTWVCCTCNRGWTSGDAEAVCTRCWKPAEMRDSYRAVEVEDLAIQD